MATTKYLYCRRQAESVRTYSKAPTKAARRTRVTRRPKFADKEEKRCTRRAAREAQITVSRYPNLSPAHWVNILACGKWRRNLRGVSCSSVAKITAATTNGKSSKPSFRRCQQFSDCSERSSEERSIPTPTSPSAEAFLAGSLAVSVEEPSVAVPSVLGFADVSADARYDLWTPPFFFSLRKNSYRRYQQGSTEDYTKKWKLTARAHGSAQNTA